MSRETNLINFATSVGTAIKGLKTLINGNVSDLSSLTTTEKSNLVAALNEVKAIADAATQTGGASIDDASTTADAVWSSSKISSEITTAIDALVSGAPTALDTIAELAAALSDDANFAATMTVALGNRVRVDAAQSFTNAQQDRARGNIGAASAADVGDPDANFVATFEVALT